MEHAKELAELLHQWGPGYHVNLIPFNPIDGTEYKRPYRKAVRVRLFGWDKRLTFCPTVFVPPFWVEQKN